MNWFLWKLCFQSPKWNPRYALVFISNYDSCAYHILAQANIWSNRARDQNLERSALLRFKWKRTWHNICAKCFSIELGVLTRNGLFSKKNVVWSNGCSRQFKSAKCWYFLLQYHNMTICDKLPSGCQMVWNYFTSNHGKGEVDRVGTLLKREIHKEQIKPNACKLQCASNVVNYLK